MSSKAPAKHAATTTIPVFDGHNDTLLNLPRTGRSFFEQSEQGHIDLPRARAGGLAGGLFAVFIPDPAEVEAEAPPADRPSEAAAGDAAAKAPADEVAPAGAPAAESVDAAAVRTTQRYSDPAKMPPPMSLDYAERTARAMAALLFRLEAHVRSRQVKVVRTPADEVAAVLAPMACWRRSCISRAPRLSPPIWATLAGLLCGRSRSLGTRSGAANQRLC